MDRSFEEDNLEMFIDWNEEEFQSTFLQTDTPFTDLEDENLMEHFNSQIELPPLPPTSSVMEPMTDPTSWFCEGSLGAENLNFVPNTLSQSLPNTQLNNPLSSADGLMLDGPVSSVQSPDMTLTDYFNQLSHLQNENSVPPQDDERNSMLQGLIPTRTENNGIEINQPLSHPGLVHPNPGQPRAGNAERSYPSGPLFVPTQTHGFSGFNDTSNSHPAGSSRSEHFQLSASDGYGAQYAPNYSYTQPPHLFTSVQNQIGHTSELQQIIALHSQDSRRSELYSNLQPGLVTMPASPFQQGYRPVLPDSATPSASLTNYGQNPSPSATTHNSFGSVSSLPPKYSQLYENPGLHHRPQVTMPNGQGQQSVASMQQWSHGVPNQIMSANTTSSQALISRLLGHTSSRTQGTREAEIAPVLRLQQEAGVLPNEVSTSRDAGKELATSSTRTQPSEAIQRILNMNPSRMVTRNFPSISEQGGSIPTERVPYVPPRRGRPPKRRDPIESYQRGKSIKVSTGGTTGTSQRAQRPQGGVVIRDLSAVLPNPPSAPRHFENAVYDMEFERQGQPLDPHLRLFKPPPGN